MTPQAQITILAWLPILIYIFIQYSPRTAVIISFLTAWLFLPQKAGFVLAGLPDYSRMNVTCYGILLATCLFDSQRLTKFKFGWLDLPMLILCITPLFSSVTNDLGIPDGLKAVLAQTVGYGVPYFLGRIYFNNLLGLRQLAISMVISGLIYVPLCLYEVRMSPQLHRMFYGYFAHSFAQTVRYGGWRPTVFMLHGLEVGMWMMSVTLIAIWLWKAGTIKTLWNISIKWLAGGLLITFILLKSTGAYIYLAYGLIIVFTAKWFRTAIPLFILIISIWLYLGGATTGNFSVQQATPMLSLISNIAGEDRAGSLEFRLINEEILVKRALEKPIFGWGGWGRNRPPDIKVVTDSLWIITYGTNGALGLISLYASSLLPAFAFCWKRYPARFWFHPQVAPAAVLAVVITLYMLDCTINAMFNPVFTLISGGIAGLVMQPIQPKKTQSKFKKSQLSRL